MSCIYSFPKNLNEAFHIVSSHPDLKELIDEVGQQGPVEIALENLKFEACWKGDERKILLNTNLDVAGQVDGLIFELFNAKSEPLFQSLKERAIQGEIDKESFVEEVEKIEHNNAIVAYALADKVMGRQTNRIFKDFSVHYKVQQIQGHSACIAEAYSQFADMKSSSYRGTLRFISPSLANDEKNKVLSLFILKRRIMEESNERARLELGLNILYFENHIRQGELEWQICLKALPDIFSEQEINQCKEIALHWLP